MRVDASAAFAGRIVCFTCTCVHLVGVSLDLTDDMEHERSNGIESRMLFVQAVPLVGAGLSILVVHHVFIVDTVRVDEDVHVGEGALGGVAEDESG